MPFYNKLSKEQEISVHVKPYRTVFKNASRSFSGGNLAQALYP